MVTMKEGEEGEFHIGTPNSGGNREAGFIPVQNVKDIGIVHHFTSV